MKTIEDFILKVADVAAWYLAYGKWSDNSPYSEDEARARAFIEVAQKYNKEKTNVDTRDHPVAVGGRRMDEGIQVLDKDGKFTQQFQDEVYTCVKGICKEMRLDARVYIDLEQSCRLIHAWMEMHSGR